MAALDTLREVTVELLVRATRRVCDGSVLNADAGRTDTHARIDDWSAVLSLYAAENESRSVRATA
jgi:hypothetical protein